MKKGILFDLDGTLWDSAEGVVISWNRALEKLGRPERVDVKQMYGLMGKTMKEIAHLVMPQEPQEEADRLLKVCTDAENAYLAEHGGVLYEGVEETLRTLKERGLFLGIVSNCQSGYIEAFLQAHRLGSLFDDTECFGNTGRGKGDNIRLTAERNGLEKVFYLGDTRGDWDAALQAGAFFIHAAYGFGTVPAGTPAIHAFRELTALPELRQTGSR